MYDQRQALTKAVIGLDEKKPKREANYNVKREKNHEAGKKRVEKSHRQSSETKHICKLTTDKVNSHTSMKWKLLKSFVISSIRCM